MGQDRTNWDKCPEDKARKHTWDMGHTPLHRRGVPCPSVRSGTLAHKALTEVQR